MASSRSGPLVLAVLASGLAAMLFVSAAARRVTPASLVAPVADGSWLARTRAWFVPQGFHHAEFDAANMRHFSWTTAHAAITVPAIDRSRAYQVRLRMAAGRSAETPPPPQLEAAVDGAPRLRVETTNAPQEYSVTIPPGSGDTFTLTLDLSNTFVPGPHDTRSLGVVVESVSIEPAEGRFRPLTRVLLLAALATMAYAFVVALCGFSAGWTLLVGLVAGALHAWLLALDAAFLGLYVQRLAWIATGAAALGTVIGFLRWRLRPSALAPEWPMAAGVAIVFGALKLAFFAHAAATIGDAVFQVHRAQYVLGGNYFFTSVTPRPFFEFPYAIALYVTAMPFWNWVQGDLDHVLLLRGLSIAADGLVGVAMYVALRRAWGDAKAALLFAALWPFAMAPQSALCTANLTNHYGQAMFGVGMGVVAWMASANRVSAAALAAAATFVAIGFLGHFSTISVGVPLIGMSALCLFALGRGATRRLGAWVLAAGLAAAAVSYVVYYSHFHDVYAKTIERVAAREGEAPSRSMVAPVSVKAGRMTAETRALFGVPVLVCAAAGFLWLWRRRPREGVTLVFTGWAVTWLAFTLLAVFTAIEMRAGLAAAPMMLALAVYALGSLAGRSRAGAMATFVVAAAIAWEGLRLWMNCLGA